MYTDRAGIIIIDARISVEFILDRMANGWTEQTTLDSYPHLVKEDLQAVFAYLND